MWILMDDKVVGWCMDFIYDFVLLFLLCVIGIIFGILEEDYYIIGVYVIVFNLVFEFLLMVFDVLDKVNIVVELLVEYFIDLVVKWCVELIDDFFFVFVYVLEDGDILLNEELIVNVIFFYVVGYEMMVGGIGLVFYFFYWYLE